MGRPREHDEQTAKALLQSAESLVQAEGLSGLSVRRVADEVGTSTRAVYSLFTSKDGLVAALGARAFDVLDAGVAGLASTGDPVADLVEAGVTVFRPFALEHPALFNLGIQRTNLRADQLAQIRTSAQRPLLRLDSIAARVPGSGTPAPRSPVRLLTIAFHAMCEGLAALELRQVLPAGQEETIWREGLTALVRGFATAPHESRPRSQSRRTSPPGRT